MSTFEPKLLGFLCNWCAYAGADLAGVSRFQYPTNLRVIRVMCSGRVDPVLIMQSFKEGIDGVAVLGCHPGDCHYQTGNYEAENKMQLTKFVLEKVGIESDRLYLDWVSAAEGKRFSEVVTSFTNQIRNIGPISKQKNYKERISFGEQIISSERIRWLVGKERELTAIGNVYNEKIDENEFKALLIKNVSLEYDIQRISKIITDTPHTVNSIAKKLKISNNEVLKNIIAMENKGIINLIDFKDRSPRYILNPVEEANK
jgi:coenzyme F420-reducing hydrogenase delta subunit